MKYDLSNVKKDELDEQSVKDHIRFLRAMDDVADSIRLNEYQNKLKEFIVIYENIKDKNETEINKNTIEEYSELVDYIDEKSSQINHKLSELREKNPSPEFTDTYHVWEMYIENVELFVSYGTTIVELDTAVCLEETQDDIKISLDESELDADLLSDINILSTNKKLVKLTDKIEKLVKRDAEIIRHIVD
jgi:hypothetical protein